MVAPSLTTLIWSSGFNLPPFDSLELIPSSDRHKLSCNCQGRQSMANNRAHHLRACLGEIKHTCPFKNLLVTDLDLRFRASAFPNSCHLCSSMFQQCYAQSRTGRAGIHRRHFVHWHLVLLALGMPIRPEWLKLAFSDSSPHLASRDLLCSLKRNVV